MRRTKRRWIIAGAAALALPAVALVAWRCLTLEPAFYRERVSMPREVRVAEARRFVAQSLQLRNDIVNEPRWEAAFTDEEVNAWLGEDLVAHFADQIPPGVHEPRIAFEMDRVTLAFRLDEGPVRSVVWVVVRVRVPEPNTLALTIEKIRAGVVPIPPDRLMGRITAYARRHGLDVGWEYDGDDPTAVVRYIPDRKRDDVVLERLQILNGLIRLQGRSNRSRGAIARPTLPTRKVLQSTFPLPRRKIQPGPRPSGRVSLHRNSATPWI